MKKNKASTKSRNVKKRVRSDAPLDKSHATLASSALGELHSKFATALKKHLPGFKIASFELVKAGDEMPILTGCRLGPDGKTIICD